MQRLQAVSMLALIDGSWADSCPCPILFSGKTGIPGHCYTPLETAGEPTSGVMLI